MFKDELKEKTDQVNKMLKDCLAENDTYGKICEAMSYSVLNGGKRLRAIMLLESFKLFSDDEEAFRSLCVPFACAIEFIHAYSLVHDDLPAMDNDVLRRGKPTTHIAYGHAMGVLTGDALLNYAFETMGAIAGKIASAPEGNALRVLKAMRTIAVKAGYSGMIGGQVLDTAAEYEPGRYVPGYRELDEAGIPEDYLDKVKYTLFIDELKTSQLFEAALMCGAILGGADEEEVKVLEASGRSLGIAFQIEDDILDMTSDSATMGKSVRMDRKNGKETVSGMLGVEKAGELVSMYTKLSVSGLRSLGKDDGFLTALFENLIYRAS